MLKTNNMNMKKRYLSFVFLVLLICVLGTIFSVSYAYLSGSFSKDHSSLNPYVNLEYYYVDGSTEYKIDKNGITGSVSSAGVVSLSVKSGSTTKTITINSTTKTFSLPIKIKNSGNVDGVVKNIFATINFLSGSSKVVVDNSYGAGLYYLQLVSSTYQIQNNSVFDISQNKIALTKNSGNSVQVLSGLKVQDAISSSVCCGKSFVINLTSTIVQENFDSISDV